MKAVIQRVTSASVTVQDKLISEIGTGLVCLIGIGKDDTHTDQDYLIKKILNLRIFPDETHPINRSIKDIDGEILLISQFTLYADTRKGNRPSFTNAMPPNQAKEFYQEFVDRFKQQYPKIKDGLFGAHMNVSLVNDGPVTIILES